ncbi:TIGR00180 family glycosyltransferase [Pseudomonas sp. 21LCFQ010]|uniref:TIGR00180 family glycosyltransferase n=1 Tax=Pseudomonas sp. 21LCFQ010 TaxID=2957506 RepID=UPI0020976A77|nr:TIGR00180 family glycosyltransferase [Pseudomonas sp. 21LCFQ010]MCO8163421.1 TIGR00180 family glycosyltransferase [Pseudomonas sp. 21LCFQ010]
MHNMSSDEAVSSIPRLTLVLVADNQADFLRRALTWYRDLPVSIKVLDASLQRDNDAAAWPGVEYLHRPALAGTGLLSRVVEGVAQVDTPYVVWADAQSFLLPAGLQQAVAFLDAHPEYGACQGYSLTYEAHVDRVDYFLRDRKVLDEHDLGTRVERVERFMAQSVPLQHAVSRTGLLQGWFAALPADVQSHWQEIGLGFYLNCVAPVRVLAVPYALHLEAGKSQVAHVEAAQGALVHIDPKARAGREACAAIVLNALGADTAQAAEAIRAGFEAMAVSLKKRPYQANEKLVSSVWSVVLDAGEPNFEPRQYLEMPFYSQSFYDDLAHAEFLIHALPAGKVQLREVEAALLRQAELCGPRSDSDAESLLGRLFQAYALYAFNDSVVRRLEQQLPHDKSIKDKDRPELIEQLSAWGQRLRAVGAQDNDLLLSDMPSGRVLSWLDSRAPDTALLASLQARQASQPKGSQIGILLLDLEADIFKLQSTFDSLLSGHYRNFKVVVFTTGELPAVTTLQHTLHFVKVTTGNYIDRINQIIKQSTSDWLMLAQSGEQFTPAGLLLASDELVEAYHCRAVAVDSIHRQPDGTLEAALLPDFNLDLLQSVPGYAARHWLIRREALLEAGGYSREYPLALEFDLLLRLIELGGLEGLAHLSEPVLICNAPELAVNDDERKTLLRHLATRGYQAEVNSLLPGAWKIDYRHEHRPLVSILIQSQDNLAELQRCLNSLLQRTRYQRFEVLIGDNNSCSPELFAWLEQQEKISSRIRVFRADQPMSAVAMLNQLSVQAQGEYLVLLDAQSQIVNVGWIESMLNQAQRPEIGVVGAKLIDPDGNVTQAGLILGFNGGVGSAFIGEPKDSRGYMQRLVIEQNYSAVSMACMMIDKALFNAVGGLDENEFAQAFADVDLCLKIGQVGGMTVWTPQVQVIHPGTVVQSASALDSLRSKWAGVFECDTAYNRHFAQQGAGFTLHSVV